MKAPVFYTYSIQVKNDRNHVVFSFKDDNGKRKLKWYSTGLPEKCTKKALKGKVAEITQIFLDAYNSGELTKVAKPKVDKSIASEALLKGGSADISSKAFEGDRMELVVYIAAYYGLRRSEICGLKWDAIDFDKKTITVCRKIVSKFDNGKEEIVCQDELKTEASKRTLPLIPKIEKMLRERMFLEVHYSRLLKKAIITTMTALFAGII